MDTGLASTPTETVADPGSPRRGWAGTGMLALALVTGMLVGYAIAVLTLGGDDSPGDTSPEAGFARDMINHHAQAVEMGLIAYDRGTLAGVRQVGYDIGTAQQGEIGTMHQWLRDWDLLPTGIGPPMSWMPDGEAELINGLMPGVASQDQMNELREAEGSEVDRLFLELMINHHLGGIHMVDGLLELSDHPEVTALAETMKRNQQGEVEVLRGLQQRLDDPDA